jgi:hypothetical protein
LDEVSEETGVTRNIVEGVYKKNKDWLKAIPNNKDENHGYAKLNFLSLLELAKINRKDNKK